MKIARGGYLNSIERSKTSLTKNMLSAPTPDTGYDMQRMVDSLKLSVSYLSVPVCFGIIPVSLSFSSSAEYASV